MIYPQIFKNLRVIAMNYLSKIRLILRYNSNRSRTVPFGVFVSAPAIALLVFQLIKGFSGFGLVVMQTTINYLADLKSQSKKRYPLYFT